jgi:hypothetical protein
MILAGFLYLALIGIVPAWAFVTYLLVTGLRFLRFRSIYCPTDRAGGSAGNTHPPCSFFSGPTMGLALCCLGGGHVVSGLAAAIGSSEDPLG